MILKRNLLSAALASAMLMTATGAYAAQPATQADNGQANQNTTKKADKKDQKKRAEATKLSAVEVTGFASSVQNSIATQRNSDVIVEAVSAEQIGKLPGTSIADSLGRLPGLAVQRLNGRPQVLTIHGLGPDFSTALVNGRQQVSTGNNRGVQFDQYPASWFNSVQVHLSPAAGLIGQGMAGTVDMHTIRPLEQDKPIAAFNASYIWNSLKQVAPGNGVSDKGYKVNGVWVHQFADRTFGVTLGIDMESNPTQIQHQAPWGYPTDNSAAGGNGLIGGSKNYATSDLFKRTGVLATLQFQPSENFTSTLDMTYDRFHDRQQSKGIEFPLAWGNAQLDPGYTVQDGLITSGTFSHVKPVIRNDYNRSLSKVYNVGWNNKWRINEDWSVEADASVSHADRRDAFIESYAGTAYGADNGPFDTLNFNQGSGGLWQLNNALDYSPSQVVLTDPQGWGGGSGLVQAGFVNAPHVVDRIADLRLSAERSFVEGPIASVKFGIDRETRNKSFNIQQRFLVPNNGDMTYTTSPWGAQTLPMPSDAFAANQLGFMGVGPLPIYDPIELIKNGTYDQVPVYQSSLPMPPNWKVHEKDTTPYVQFNLDTQLGNFPLRGNFGIQVAHTTQDSDGGRVAAGSSYVGETVVIPVSGGTSYTRYLPSLNLVLGLTDTTDVRFGAARTMARPRMDQMNASFAINTNNSNLASSDPNNAYFSSNAGNPKLLPSMAQNYNLSIEHYFGDSKGYMSLSGYFLKLSDYINPSTSVLTNFSQFVDSYLTPAQQQQLGSQTGIATVPTNSGRGYVKGVQGVLNTPLGLFTPALDGFGVIFSGNLTKSSIVYDGNPNPITVPGLSEHVVNNTIYYEHSGFQARVSQNYRSSFLGRVYGISASRIEQTIKGGSTYDAQISYTLQSGPMKGMTFLLQGSNLSNEKFVTYQNHDPRQVLTWENYGRRYEVGVSYKF
ncbi:TonB-dependent receptor [Oleiagrimonas soli]|uniref:Iron complex outermembrane receptor protein n=1 Tax=Oleiagrimonas soli TaxID=1543381 RepID=A0A099CV20_9GAMM|nr:TonB-dependent receptor [Oleiagrimonas soli]KGI76870.1 TonB-dependent receptor [Oleiagrimonas soli]MBB6185273.1 iron complex outermembrane receptor protein [Oleiagrimonas soli]